MSETTETTETEPTYCVFVDTCYLYGISQDEVDWGNLLLLSEQKKVKIFISHIVLEEWRTKRLDEAVVKRSKAIAALGHFKKEIGADIILKGQINVNLSLETLLPSESDIKEASLKAIKGFIKKNKIEVIAPKDTHQQEMLRKYFSWKAPFQVDHNHKKPNKREFRRTHIPDALIAEAALEKKNEGYTVLFLGKDGNLSNALKKSSIACYEKSQEILLKLNISPDAQLIIPSKVSITPDTPQMSVRPTEPKPAPIISSVAISECGDTVEAQGQVQETVPPVEEFPAGADLDTVNSALSAYEREDRKLQARVLGYVHWSSPAKKKDLAFLLERKGFSIARTINAAERLCLAEFLEDTGNTYIPKNKPLCAAAGNLVIEEFNEVSDG